MRRGRSNSSVTTLELLPLPRSPGFTRRPGTSSVASTPFENVQKGDIDICKVHTDLNVADPLTKPLPRAKHDQHQNAMGVQYITM